MPEPVLTSFHFAIEFDGADSATWFSELSGVTSEIDAIDFRSQTPEGQSAVERIPGKSKPPTISLKRGVSANDDLWAWHMQAASGDLGCRRSGALIFLDTAGAEVKRYTFDNAWPSKVEIGTTKADSNEVTLESVTIVCGSLIGPGGA